MKRVLWSVIGIGCALAAVAWGGPLDEMASRVAAGVGEVRRIVAGEDGPVVFVFEEIHSSILQQVEIAIMLDRLYSDSGLRRIGLEGLMAPETLDLRWAHVGAPYRPGTAIGGRIDVIVQSLQDGEIGSAECLGLVYEDLEVSGIDDASLYADHISVAADHAPYDYLYAIALAGMSGIQRTVWEALLRQELYREAFLHAVSTDPFTADRLARLEDRVDVISAEEMRVVVDELRARAAAVRAQLDPFPGAVEGLAEMREYLITVSARSDVLAERALALAPRGRGAPIAVTVGAMHTDRVAEQLVAAGASVVVVRTSAQASKATAGMLSSAAFGRRADGGSAAPDGWLGSFLDGRRKPRPISEEEWYRIYHLLDLVAQTLANAAEMLERGEIHDPAGEVLTTDEGASWLQEVASAVLAAHGGVGISVRVDRVTYRDDELGRHPVVEFQATLRDGRTLGIRAWADPEARKADSASRIPSGLGEMAADLTSAIAPLADGVLGAPGGIERLATEISAAIGAFCAGILGRPETVEGPTPPVGPAARLAEGVGAAFARFFAEDRRLGAEEQAAIEASARQAAEAIASFLTGRPDPQRPLTDEERAAIEASATEAARSIAQFLRGRGDEDREPADDERTAIETSSRQAARAIARFLSAGVDPWAEAARAVGRFLSYGPSLGEPLSERLAAARDALLGQEAPVPETGAGETPPLERACSDTYLSVARTAG